MGVKINGTDSIKAKLAGFFDNFREELGLVGERAAEGIVRTTLAGIGEDDTPFTPYSPGYLQKLSVVGGKPGGQVNLRGVFYPPGKGPKPPRKGVSLAEHEKRLLAKGALRRAYLTITAGGKTFTVRTGLTRPQVGLRDPLSEMSLDLIRVEAQDNNITLTYEPRGKEHMIYHQRGKGKLPRRVWFTLNRKAIKQDMLHVLGEAIKARAQWFNDR